LFWGRGGDVKESEGNGQRKGNGGYLSLSCSNELVKRMKEHQDVRFLPPFMLNLG